VYSFKRKDGKNLGDNFDKKDFLMDIFRIDMDVRSELEPLITKEKITIDEANFSHWHKVWEVYTKENPEFEYTKTKAF
jgi:hypothetical protein